MNTTKNSKTNTKENLRGLTKGAKVAIAGALAAAALSGAIVAGGAMPAMAATSTTSHATSSTTSTTSTNNQFKVSPPVLENGGSELSVPVSFRCDYVNDYFNITVSVLQEHNGSSSKGSATIMGTCSPATKYVTLKVHNEQGLKPFVSGSAEVAGGFSMDGYPPTWTTSFLPIYG